MKNQPIRPFVLAAALLVAGGGTVRAQFTLLHTFDNTNGASPYYGAPVIAGTTLYGVTGYGGSSNNGVIYAMNLDGSDYSVLHTFTGAGSDGSKPFGSVVLEGQTLYGATYYGGTSGNGAIFAINTNGSGYTTLASLTAAAGYKPYGTLTASGAQLYGTTYYSSGGQGSVFSVGTNGTGYTTVYNFAGGGTSGAKPLGSLIASGSTLYGMTAYGGNGGDAGVIYRVQADGSGYTNLYNFTGNADSGARPYGILTLAGSTFYGLAKTGGTGNDGVLFSLNLDGSGYTNLYSFAGGAASGINPNGSLTLDGSVFYGTARNGGISNAGVVFAVYKEGLSYIYTNLYSFTGGADGAFPVGDLALNDNTLYGWTSAGGANNKGTLFSIAAIPEPSTLLCLFCGAGVALLRRWRRTGG